MNQKETVKKEKRPLVKCPHCDYTCHGKQPLGRHIHYKHPEQHQREPKISIRISTIRGLLQAVDDKLATGELDHITGRLGKKIKEQDFKFRLTLIAIACSKAERAVATEDMLNRAAAALNKKLTPEVLELRNVSFLVDLLDKLSRSVSNDTGYLKELLSMKGGSSSAFFLRSVELLKGSAGSSQQSLEAMLVRVLKTGDGGLGGLEVESFQRMVSDIIAEEQECAPGRVLESTATSSGEGVSESDSTDSATAAD